MNPQNLLAAMLIVLSCGNCLNAATVILSLYPNQNGQGVATPGAFRITAKVLGNDSAGLSGYGGDLTGNITFLDHLSPRDASFEHNGTEGPAGFTLGRSADNAKFVVGFQDTPNPDVYPIYGFGQTAGTLPPGPGIPELQQHWDAELLLAVGTYTGPVGGPNGLGWNQTGPNRAANVFINKTGLAVRLPEELLLVVVPEPASAAIVGVSLLGLAALRRRAA